MRSASTVDTGSSAAICRCRLRRHLMPNPGNSALLRPALSSEIWTNTAPARFDARHICQIPYRDGSPLWGHWPEAVVNRFQRPSAGRGLSAYPSHGDGGWPAKFRARNQERSRFHQPRGSVNRRAHLQPLQQKKPASRSQRARGYRTQPVNQYRPPDATSSIGSNSACFFQ